MMEKKRKIRLLVKSEGFEKPFDFEMNILYMAYFILTEMW